MEVFEAGSGWGGGGSGWGCSHNKGRSNPLFSISLVFVCIKCLVLWVISHCSATPIRSLPRRPVHKQEHAASISPADSLVPQAPSAPGTDGHPPGRRLFSRFH